MLLGPGAKLHATATAAAGKGWSGQRMARQTLVGFGRASSNGYSRAVLWDVVMTGDLQDHGLGRRVVEELLHPPQGCRGVERVYL